MCLLLSLRVSPVYLLSPLSLSLSLSLSLLIFCLRTKRQRQKELRQEETDINKGDSRQTLKGDRGDSY